jgi:hypothetical protein
VQVLEVMKEVGRRWKSLIPEEKQIFENKAKEDKKRYNKEMEKFNKEINKVSITMQDEKKKPKVGVKKVRSKKGKKNSRKRIKKSIDTQGDYYYPGKNYDAKNSEKERPKNDYSLRRRNRRLNKDYFISASEESEEQEDEEEERTPKDPKEEDKFSGHGSIPKKPLSPYIFFSQKVRDEIKRDNPRIAQPNLMKEISERWKNSNEHEREPYHTMAKEDKIRYEQELNSYKQNVRMRQREDLGEIESLQRQKSNNDISVKSMNPLNDPDFQRGRDIRVNYPQNRGVNNTIPLNIFPDSQQNQVIRKERRSKQKYDYPTYRINMEGR